MHDKTLDSDDHAATVLGGLTPIVCVLALWAVAGASHAAPIFKCVDAQGGVAYRDTACPGHTRQARIEVHAQPTIGNADEVAAARAPVSTSHPGRTATRSRKHPTQRKRAKPAMSWECHAADGEVFYRHTRCPGSVPGDGTVRTDFTATTTGNQTQRHRNAWSSVRVHAVKITRSKACQRIHAAGAAGRDGHLRDTTVSTYDHLMGRDPCSGD